MCVEPLSPDILDERTFDARTQFADVFDVLLQTRSLPNATGVACYAEQELRVTQELQSLLNADQSRLQTLPRHAEYSRHVIGTRGNWMGFICRWEANACSSIHGHPSFAYYQVIRGEFKMDFYDITDNDHAQLANSTIMNASECVWQTGEAGRYDNLVHRVSCEKSGGLTLHLFSENPALGWHYPDN